MLETADQKLMRTLGSQSLFLGQVGQRSASTLEIVFPVFRG